MSQTSFLQTRTIRILVGIVIGVLAVMWIYVLFIAKPVTPDRLSDRSFPTAAEPICAATITTMKNAGLVNQQASSPQDRAQLADRADAQLTDMVAQLRTKVPATGEAHDAVSKWLDDWDQWLRDRAAWTAKLRAGEDVQFLEKQRDSGEPNSQALNAFAVTNDMGSCQTPAGV
ncbi:MAG TPA: hypothetical protein VH419_16120 [Nocardioidaceae bacterium]|jgi:hypothetical protein